MSPLIHWESFYVIVGSSAAALTGLQFVVIALVADMQVRSSTREVEAFATPTIVHFGAVLLLSGMLTAPWHGLSILAWLVGIAGVAGIVYSILIARRARRTTHYMPVFEDWLFHVVLPAAAYATVTAAASMLRIQSERALFAVGAAALLLLFIGIHNAWDAVTYIVVSQRAREPRPPGTPRSDPDRAASIDKRLQPHRAEDM